MREFLKKHEEKWAYLFFGVLTTAVNYLIYFPCDWLLGLSAGASNVVAWVGAVAFAFLTNKPFVFKSNDWSPSVVWPELTKFVGSRLGSGILETVLLVVTVDWLGWSDIWMKLLAAVFVVVLNYIGSKLLVFRK